MTNTLRRTPHDRDEVTTAEWSPATHEHVRVSRRIDRPVADVERVLRIEPDRLVRAAYGVDVAATSTVIALPLFGSLKGLRVPVRVEFRTPRPPRHAIISLKWQATYLNRYFPVLEADIEVHAGPDVADLELNGTYLPPLGIAGLVFDRFIGRRIATSAAVGFVDALATAIEQDDRAKGAA